jgi:hypothetical protein
MGRSVFILLVFLLAASVSNASLAGDTFSMPADRPIDLMVMQEVSAKTATPGTRFRLETVNEIQVGSEVAIPPGAQAWGEVIDAEAAGAGGRGGRIAVRLLYLEAGGQRFRLDGASSTDARRSTRDVAALSASLGVFAIFAKGHDARLKAGEIVTGFVVDDRAPSPQDRGFVLLPSDTPVTLETLSIVSSETGSRGDRVALAIAEDVLVDGRVAIPKGARGFAQIVRADAKSGFGVGGRLALQLLYVESGQHIVRLRGTMSWSGRHSGTRGIAGNVFTSAAAVAITGRRAEIPAGTRIKGQVLRSVAVPLR